MTQIKGICGMEPSREGEYPCAYYVGSQFGNAGIEPCGIVTEIRYREDNYGDHGLGWYDVFIGEVRVASMQARAVADIFYFTPTQEPPHD